jgi:hypothetical protein
MTTLCTPEFSDFPHQFYAGAYRHHAAGPDNVRNLLAPSQLFYYFKVAYKNLI